MARSRSASSDVDELSLTIVEAVADAEGVAPEELVPPLYSVVDPDALDQMFLPTPTDGRLDGEVTFWYQDYRVTACGDGFVRVEDPSANG